MSGWAWGLVLWGTLALAVQPLAMTLANLRRFRRLEPGGKSRKAKGGRETSAHEQEDRPWGTRLSSLRLPSSPPGPVSVLIPARDEEAGIAEAVEAALASALIELEVVVLDDHSSDGTAAIVRRIARRDPRVRLVRAPPLPPGWCGKPHACHVLAGLARFDRLTWIDADVRLGPQALARMTDFHDAGDAALVSGFPRAVTGTWLEKLVIPLIPAVLMGYLPMGRMRASASPAYGAGCGQWFMTTRQAYQRAGGHAAIRASRHDGITLPRAFRRAGLMTDVCDASDVASCRMYRSAGQVWRGLAKNATEAMAAPAAIGGWSALLIGGWVLPWVNLAAAAALWWAGAAVGAWQGVVVIAAAAAAAGTSVVLGRRFGQPWLAVVGRPAGAAVLVAIQWYALVRAVAGKPVPWHGRDV